LAGVVAVAAIETKIRQIGKIRFGKNPPPLDRRKHRAITLAVPAGIANAHLPFAFFD
jgi:hypothetical protein